MYGFVRIFAGVPWEGRQTAMFSVFVRCFFGNFRVSLLGLILGGYIYRYTPVATPLGVNPFEFLDEPYVSKARVKERSFTRYK